MLADLFEIILNYYQYFALILQTEGVEFPSSWSASGDTISIANLDLAFFRDQAELVPKDLDFRVYFMLVCVVIPLALNFFGLFLLNSHVVIVWYFVALMGLMMTSAGLAGTLLKQSDDFSLDADTANSMLVFGIAMLVFCFVTLLIRKTAGCCEDDRQKIDTKGMSIKQILALETRDCNLTGSVEYMGIVVALLILGCIFAGFMSSTALSTHRVGINSTSFANFTFSLGLIIIIVGGIVFLWTMASVCEVGRRAQWHFSNFVQSNLMKIILIIMSVVYMPVGSGVFLMFNCNVFKCGSNERLIDYGSAVVANTTLGPACSACSLGAGQVCPSQLQRDVCAAAEDPRLEFDLHIPCKNMRTFYWPAAAMIVVSFIAGVPVLFYRVIKRSTEMVTETIPIDSNITDEEDIWAAKVASTRNVAKFLYQPFEYRFRYMRLFQIVQKFVIVLTATYIFRAGFSSANIALNVALGVHSVVFVALFILAPYIVRFEDRVSYFVAFQLVLAALTAELILYDVKVPEWWTTVLVVINSAIPLLALVAGALLAYFTMKQEEQARLRAADKAIQHRVQSFAKMFEAGKLTSSVHPSMPVYAALAASKLKTGSGSAKQPDGGDGSSLSGSQRPDTASPATLGEPDAPVSALRRNSDAVVPAMTPPALSPRAGSPRNPIPASPRANLAPSISIAAATPSPGASEDEAGGKKKKKKIVRRVVVVKKKKKSAVSDAGEDGADGPAEEGDEEEEASAAATPATTAGNAVGGATVQMPKATASAVISPTSAAATALARRESAQMVRATVSKAIDSDDEELSDDTSESSVDFDMSSDEDDDGKNKKQQHSKHSKSHKHKSAVSGSGGAAALARPMSQSGAKPLEAMNMTMTKKPSLPLLDRAELLRMGSPMANSSRASPRGSSSGADAGAPAPSPRIPPPPPALPTSGSAVGSPRFPPAGASQGSVASASASPLGSQHQLQRMGTASGSFRPTTSETGQKLSLAERKAQFSVSTEGTGLRRGDSGVGLNGTLTRRPSDLNSEGSAASPSGVFRPTTSQVKVGKDAANLAPRNPLAAPSRQGGRGTTTALAKQGSAASRMGLSEDENEFGAPSSSGAASPIVPWGSTTSADIAAGGSGLDGSINGLEGSLRGTDALAMTMSSLSGTKGPLTMSQRQHIEATLATREKYDKELHEMLTRKKTLGITGDAAVKALVPIAEREVEEQQQFLDELVADADHTINAAVRKELNVYLIISGMLTFVALGFCFLGLMVQTTPGVLQANGANTFAVHHFTEYGSFENFTAACCCLEYNLPPPARTAKVEKWICANGDKIERVRSFRKFDQGGNVLSIVDSTRAVRGMCAVTFSSPNTCGLVYQERDGVRRVSLQCSDPTVTDEMRPLW